MVFDNLYPGYKRINITKARNMYYQDAKSVYFATDRDLHFVDGSGQHKFLQGHPLIRFDNMVSNLRRHCNDVYFYAKV